MSDDYAGLFDGAAEPVMIDTISVLKDKIKEIGVNNQDIHEIFPSIYPNVINVKLCFDGFDLDCKRCLHHVYGMPKRIFQLKHDGTSYYANLLCEKCSKNPIFSKRIVKEIKLDQDDNMTQVLADAGISKTREIFI